MLGKVIRLRALSPKYGEEVGRDAFLTKIAKCSRFVRHVVGPVGIAIAGLAAISLLGDTATWSVYIERHNLVHVSSYGCPHSVPRGADKGSAPASHKAAGSQSQSNAAPKTLAQSPKLGGDYFES